MDRMISTVGLTQSLFDPPPRWVEQLMRRHFLLVSQLIESVFAIGIRLVVIQIFAIELPPVLSPAPDAINLCDSNWHNLLTQERRTMTLKVKETILGICQ